MTTVLLALPLRSKQDLLLARKRARQIAGLLGFGPRDQIVLAANVFANVGRFRQVHACGMLRFQLTENALHIFPVARASISVKEKRTDPGKLNGEGINRLLRRLNPSAWSSAVEIPFGVLAQLPDQPLSHDREDLPWLAQQLARLTPLDLFEEFQHQNQEIMQLLQETPAGGVVSRPSKMDAANPAA
jgi:hypothetical protein